MLSLDRTSDPVPQSSRQNRRRIAAHPTSVAAFVGYFAEGPENDAIRVRRVEDVERTFGGLQSGGEAALGLHQFFRNGGSVAVVVRTSRGASGLIGTPGSRSGLHALLDLDPYAFNLVCIPDASHLDVEGQRQVYSAAARLCERQRAFLICDLPVGATTSGDALAWMKSAANPDTPNGAVYFPRLRLSPPLSDAGQDSVAASGTVAGILARVDAEKGVWRPPAGNDARIVGAMPASALEDVDSRALNPRAVNAARTLPSAGTVLWGARTLRGDDALEDAFKYIPTRRLALHIEQSVHRGLSWAVFERYGEPVWEEVRRTVEAFLHTLFEQDAFRGEVPEQAYYVRCDRTTMTPADVEAGRLNVEMGFAPIRPAEFVILRISLQAS